MSGSPTLVDFVPSHGLPIPNLLHRKSTSPQGRMSCRLGLSRPCRSTVHPVKVEKPAPDTLTGCSQYQSNQNRSSSSSTATAWLCSWSCSISRTFVLSLRTKWSTTRLDSTAPHSNGEPSGFFCRSCLRASSSFLFRFFRFR